MREQIKNGLRSFRQAFGQLMCLYPQTFDKDIVEELEKMRRLFATRSDREALSQDWQNVGRYLQTGMDSLGNVQGRDEELHGTSRRACRQGVEACKSTVVREARVPTVFDVADFFLAQQDENAGDLISSLMLQKLCYYAQGFTLAMTGRPLFQEKIEAWCNGPVIPALYEHYRRFDGGALPKPDVCLGDIRARFAAEEQEILEDVYRVYGQFSAWKLRDMTREEPPWM